MQKESEMTEGGRVSICVRNEENSSNRERLKTWVDDHHLHVINSKARTATKVIMICAVLISTNALRIIMSHLARETKGFRTRNTEHLVASNGEVSVNAFGPVSSQCGLQYIPSRSNRAGKRCLLLIPMACNTSP